MPSCPLLQSGHAARVAAEAGTSRRFELSIMLRHPGAALSTARTPEVSRSLTIHASKSSG